MVKISLCHELRDCLSYCLITFDLNKMITNAMTEGMQGHTSSFHKLQFLAFVFMGYAYLLLNIYPRLLKFYYSYNAYNPDRWHAEMCFSRLNLWIFCDILDGHYVVPMHAAMAIGDTSFTKGHVSQLLPSSKLHKPSFEPEPTGT